MNNPARNRILVPIDFSEHSQAALRRALYLARLLDHKVALLHVVDTASFVPVAHGAQAVLEYGHFTTKLRDDAREKLRAIAKEADPEGKCVDVVDVVEGRPWQVILHVASSEHPALIVCGKRGHGAEAGMGSVAERVVRGAPCDVLVVREAIAPKPDLEE